MAVHTLLGIMNNFYIININMYLIAYITQNEC